MQSFCEPEMGCHVLTCEAVALRIADVLDVSSASLRLFQIDFGFHIAPGTTNCNPLRERPSSGYVVIVSKPLEARWAIEVSKAVEHTGKDTRCGSANSPTQLNVEWISSLRSQKLLIRAWGPAPPPRVGYSFFSG